MAINVPMPELPGTGFLKGLDTGSTMFTRLMQPILEREKQKQQAEQFAQELALRKQAESRMGASAGLNRQLLQQQIIAAQHANDPKWALQQLQAKLDYIQNMGRQGQGGQQQQPQTPVSLMDMIGGQDQGQQMPQGQGPLMPEEQPQQPINQPQDHGNQLPGGIDLDEIKRALTYQAFGLKVPTNGVYKEPPALKRMNDLQAKMEEAKFKHEIKMEEERSKNELKNQATRQKVIDNARNDLPHLKETLRSLKIMKKIADDKANSDLFGHWWLGHDKAAQRATNPNAGTWQVYGLDPIVQAEMKMSARGNQLALKSALQNKANFGEDQAVAAKKIDGSIDKIQRQINEMEKIANEGSDDFSNMTDEQLRAIVGGK